MSLPREFVARIEAIRANRTDGAFELARQAADAVSLLRREEFGEAARLIERAQPSMAPLAHLARRLRTSTDVREFIETLETSNAVIARHVPAVFARESVVVTHSASATVLGFILAADALNRISEVIAMESLPGGEGCRFATALGSRDLRVEVAPDSELASAIGRSDLALTGADWISPDHIVNEVGTAALCKAARDGGIPVYCVASKLKMLPFDPPPDASGLFEAVPRDLFTAVVSEEGVHAADERR